MAAILPMNWSTTRPARSLPRRATRSTEKMLTALKEAGFHELNLLDIDHINAGAYIRNTLKADKVESYEQALIDIYRVMRPASRRPRDGAGAVQRAVLRRRALRPLGCWPRQDEHAARTRRPDTMRVLRKEDILAVIKTLADLRDGKGEVDDIDHLGNRRVRSVGELMENQYRARPACAWSGPSRSACRRSISTPSCRMT